MLWWRIVRRVHVADPLSGEGAALFGSRWNSIGVRMAYASNSQALAVLEMLVHLARDRTPPDSVLVPVEIPDELTAELQEPPAGWNDSPYSRESKRIGDRWIEQGSSLAILVPSAVLPSEHNILVNPAHAHFGRIRIGHPELNAFDKRLFGMK